MAAIVISFDLRNPDVGAIVFPSGVFPSNENNYLLRQRVLREWAGVRKYPMGIEDLFESDQLSKVGTSGSRAR